MKFKYINHSTFKSVFILLTIACFFACTQNKEQKKESSLNIWFNAPTTDWNKGLPIGNGSLGAMVYGTPEKEIIGLNEETIWTGGKHYDRDMPEAHKYIDTIRQLLFKGKYIEAEALVEENVLNERFPWGTHSYQILGNLFVESPELDSVTNYKRQLDINKALITTQFEKDGVHYTRENFSSFPDKAMVLKYTADKKGKINFSTWIERTENTKIITTKNNIQFSEHVGNGFGVKFHAILNIETQGGSTEVVDGKLVIKQADKVIIKIVAASDYRGLEPEKKCKQDLEKVLSSSYNELLERHLIDYRSLFKRVDLKLTESNGEDLPTDERLQQLKDGETDNYLTQLQYQFGRYLLISSSRPGTLPANLQGIWADGFEPPWNSDYHININIQMNYWLAEMTNLSECHRPFLKFIGDLREMGRITAKKVYGARGFVAHHTSDAWHATAAFGKSRHGMWPMGAAWSCQHLFTHYEYTEDKQYLRDYAYPVMKEAALFFVDFLVTDPNTGLLVSGPSVSPENNFLTKEGKKGTLNMAPTMDRQIIFELFGNCVKAANILGIDQEFVNTLQTKISQIPPMEVGSDGRLMEWVEEFDEPMPGHRHISHLYGLHPSNQISKTKTPELFEAAKKTIAYRLSHGGGHTGWSRAWIINFFARLQDGQKSHENIVALQQKSTLPNLLDLHPPFQIDGNFGVVSGITEMLMQSHDDEINVLPALPKEWRTGAIKGIVARKGFEVDIFWENEQLKELIIKSRLGNSLDLRYGELTLHSETQKEEVLKFDNQLNKIK